MEKKNSKTTGGNKEGGRQMGAQVGTCPTPERLCSSLGSRLVMTDFRDHRRCWCVTASGTEGVCVLVHDDCVPKERSPSPLRLDSYKPKDVIAKACPHKGLPLASQLQMQWSGIIPGLPTTKGSKNTWILEF